jgi:hypothetical protein
VTVEERLEHELDLAHRSGDWRKEVEAAAEIFQFHLGHADAQKLDEHAERMRALLRSILDSGRVPDHADREELQRTLLSIDAGRRSFHGAAASERFKLATAAAAHALAERDYGRASEEAAAAEAARTDLLARTEGSMEGWPESLQHSVEDLREKAESSAPSIAMLAELAAKGQAGALHPQQLAGGMKFLQAQAELDRAQQQADAIRRDLRTGSLRRRAVNLVALGLTRMSVMTFRRTARSYERTASRSPRSAALYARARAHREAAAESLDAAEQHRRASGAALDVPTANPAVASVVQFVFGWAIIGAALAANAFVFSLFDESYFRWYLENGALISIVFGFVSLAVHLDDYPDLVSSNPMRYLRACWTLNFHLVLAWSQVVSVDPERSKGVLFSRVFDSFVSLLAMLGVTIAFAGWLVVVAPIQHLAYAVLGAPARNALRNPTAPRYDPATDLTTTVSPAGVATGHALGYIEKPVALTSALTAAVLWIGSQVLW